MTNTTETIYADAQFGGRLQWGRRPAVLVVDLSYGFTDRQYTLGSPLDDVIEATMRVLHAARASGAPVAFTTIAFDDHQLRTNIWIQKSPALAELRAGTRPTAIDERLQRRPDEPLIAKQCPSALFNTGAVSELRGWGADMVVLCGATTSGCVRATAIDLMQAGYPTIIPRDCVGDRAPDAHRASLLDLQAKYVDVVSTDEAIAHLDSTGRTVSASLADPR